MDILQAQIDAEYEQLLERHLCPSRLVRLAFGMTKETEKDRRHLQRCQGCRRALEAYLQREAV